MYKKEFETRLIKEELPSTLFVYGDAPYIRTLIIDEALQKAPSDAQISTFYPSDYNPSAIKSLLSESSLFGDQTVVLLMIEEGVKLTKSDLTSFVSAASTNPTATLLINYDGSHAKEFDKLISSSQGWSVRVFPPHRQEAIDILLTQAKKLALPLSAHCAAHLLQLHREDLSLATSEFPKLAILGRAITLNDLDQLVYGLGDVDMDLFFYRLLAKETLLHEIDDLLDSLDGGEVRFINALQSFITQLFLFHTYIKSFGQPDAVKILGYAPPKAIIDQKAQAALRLKTDHFQMILSKLLETEYQLKLSKKEKRPLIYALLMEIKSNL